MTWCVYKRLRGRTRKISCHRGKAAAMKAATKAIERMHRNSKSRGTIYAAGTRNR